MLLRSISKHVKDQNWFAVALDFVIVVGGVFIGLQVANWNEARASQARSEQYLERIATDLVKEIAIYDDRIQFWRQVSDNGLVVLDEANNGGKLLKPWELLLAYFQASQVAEFFPSNATFEELKSAGELGLIRDAHLRSQLSEYYAYPGYESLRERPPYREHVRSIIPVRMQLYIWSNCYQTDGGIQTLKSCSAPAEDSEIQPVIDRLNSSEPILDELRYWVSALEVANIIVQGNSEIARGLLDELMIELGQKSEAAP
ncbi:hypothetical protein GCM10009069_15920 [Algimonas arctica]|uniref:Uncharacterized protein n=1 Tax=Algimonas arctica TaxID=1479486 RepID=A0A8J3CQA3_9PROT|nr:hypothetical protein [Algimonas arctica]GHA93649.1 hypothetical protein GCM10009069_15920 [Algimonas arctica]